MADTGASSTSPDTRPTHESDPSTTHEVSGGRVSCATCRRRKIKCDKLSPCSHCIRSHIYCEYAPRKRVPKRNKWGINSEREAELISRLNKLEGTVKGSADNSKSITLIMFNILPRILRSAIEALH